MKLAMTSIRACAFVCVGERAFRLLKHGAIQHTHTRTQTRNQTFSLSLSCARALSLALCPSSSLSRARALSVSLSLSLCQTYIQNKKSQTPTRRIYRCSQALKRAGRPGTVHGGGGRVAREIAVGGQQDKHDQPQIRLGRPEDCW